mmetsp:Transcript_138266/g.359329  ORF Transcript_138266/g.359329 Transcript_138266/m.359329 type:complete len:216 (-) Transcript_138266:36-683(-)
MSGDDHHFSCGHMMVHVSSWYMSIRSLPSSSSYLSLLRAVRASKHTKSSTFHNGTSQDMPRMCGSFFFLLLLPSFEESSAMSSPSPSGSSSSSAAMTSRNSKVCRASGLRAASWGPRRPAAEDLLDPCSNKSSCCPGSLRCLRCCSSCSSRVTFASPPLPSKRSISSTPWPSDRMIFSTAVAPARETKQQRAQHEASDANPRAFQGKTRTRVMAC